MISLFSAAKLDHFQHYWNTMQILMVKIVLGIKKLCT